MKLAFRQTTASVFLDLVRTGAALLVCFEHWRGLTFIDFPAIDRHRAFWAIPYVLSDGGHQAVIVFFVLSGYLVGGQFFRFLRDDRWTWRLYLAHRLARLWVVLVPALVLGGVLDLVALHFRLAPALYAGRVVNHLPLDVAASLNWPSFVGSLVFLQTIVVKPFGSNRALWSLANEFWYYILFPLAFLALRPGSAVPLVRRICGGALFVAIALYVGKEIMILFPIWLLGVLLAVVPLPAIRSGVRWAAAGLYLPLFFGLAKGYPVTGVAADYILGFATFSLLLCLLTCRSEAPRKAWVRFSRIGAGFSYTLYLVHLPLLVFGTALLVGENRWAPGFRSGGVGLLELGAVIFCAFAIARVTESHTEKVREWALAKTAKRVHRSRRTR